MLGRVVQCQPGVRKSCFRPRVFSLTCCEWGTQGPGKDLNAQWGGLGTVLWSPGEMNHPQAVLPLQKGTFRMAFWPSLLAREGLNVLEIIFQNKALELRVLLTGIWGSSFRAFHVSIFQVLPKWDELPWWQKCRKSKTLRSSRFAARPLRFLRNERGGGEEQ